MYFKTESETPSLLPIHAMEEGVLNSPFKLPRLPKAFSISPSKLYKKMRPLVRSSKA